MATLVVAFFYIFIKNIIAHAPKQAIIILQTDTYKFVMTSFLVSHRHND